MWWFSGHFQLWFYWNKSVKKSQISDSLTDVFPLDHWLKWIYYTYMYSKSFFNETTAWNVFVSWLFIALLLKNMTFSLSVTFLASLTFRCKKFFCLFQIRNKHLASVSVERPRSKVMDMMKKFESWLRETSVAFLSTYRACQLFLYLKFFVQVIRITFSVDSCFFFEEDWARG